MMIDTTALVASAYDRIADRYLEKYEHSKVRGRWLDALISATTRQSRVLDLGCGAGVPVANVLVGQERRVVGVDASARQIELARRNVSRATFLHADMTSVQLESGSFDAVGAFYSINHLRFDQQAALFRRVASWLRPGGTFVASLGSDRLVDWKGVWLGAETYFSRQDAKTNLRLLGEAGFTIESARLAEQDVGEGRYLWIVARRNQSQQPPRRI